MEKLYSLITYTFQSQTHIYKKTNFLNKYMRKKTNVCNCINDLERLNKIHTYNVIKYARTESIFCRVTIPAAATDSDRSFWILFCDRVFT